MTQATRSPHAVAESFVRATAESEWDQLADLYAVESVIEMPFAPPGVPLRLEGREGHRERFRGMAPLMRIDKIDGVRILDTSDPEVVFVEYTMHATPVETGRSYSNTHAMLMWVRDGEIVLLRDYANSLAGAQAFGTLPTIYQALTAND